MRWRHDGWWGRGPVGQGGGAPPLTAAQGARDPLPAAAGVLGGRGSPRQELAAVSPSADREGRARAMAGDRCTAPAVSCRSSPRWSRSVLQGVFIGWAGCCGSPRCGCRWGVGVAAGVACCASAACFSTGLVASSVPGRRLQVVGLAALLRQRPSCWCWCGVLAVWTARQLTEVAFMAGIWRQDPSFPSFGRYLHRPRSSSPRHRFLLGVIEVWLVDVGW